MKDRRAWIIYSTLRLLAIIVPLVILLILGAPWIVATVVAVVVGLCISYIFFRKQREAVSREIYEMRNHRKKPITADDDAEDAFVDENEVQAATRSRNSPPPDDDEDDQAPPHSA